MIHLETCRYSYFTFKKLKHGEKVKTRTGMAVAIRVLLEYNHVYYVL